MRSVHLLLGALVLGLMLSTAGPAIAETPRWTGATTAATNGFIVYNGCSGSVLLNAAASGAGFAYSASSVTTSFDPPYTYEPPPNGRPTALSPMTRSHSYLQFPQGPGADQPPPPQIEVARVFVTNDGAYRC